MFLGVDRFKRNLFEQKPLEVFRRDDACIVSVFLIIESFGFVESGLNCPLLIFGISSRCEEFIPKRCKSVQSHYLSPMMEKYYETRNEND